MRWSTVRERLRDITDPVSSRHREHPTRNGFILLALIGLAVYMAMADGGWQAKLIYGLLAEIPLAVAGLVFVWLGRGFGAFGEDELAGQGPQG